MQDASSQLVRIWRDTWRDGRNHPTRHVNCATVANHRQASIVLSNCDSPAALDRYKTQWHLRDNGRVADKCIIIQSKTLCGHSFGEIPSYLRSIRFYCTPGHCDPAGFRVICFGTHYMSRIKPNSINNIQIEHIQKYHAPSAKRI